MRPSVRLAARLYAALLRLYPPGFRREFGDEMRAVFEQAAAQADARGGWPLAVLCLRELRDLPGAALAQHLREMWMAESFNPMNDDRPGTWAQAALAALPHLLIALLFSLPGLVGAAGASTGVFLLVASVVFLAAVGIGVVAGWRKGWPRWSAGWLSYALIIAVMLVEDRLLNGFGGTGDRVEWNTVPYLGRQMLSEIVVPCALVGLLYAIARRDLVMGLIAALPLAHFTWLFHLEFVPAVPGALVLLAAWGVVALAVALMVRRGRRASGVWLAVGASALVGLLYSFGAVYLSEVEAFGPRAVGSIWRQFAPDFLESVPLLLGLALGRRFWEHSRWSGRLGRLAFWLALAGFLAFAAGMLSAYRLFLPDDLTAFQPSLGPWLWLTILLGAQAYLAGAALIGFASWKNWSLAGRAAYALLAVLLLLAPAMNQLTRVLAVRSLPVVLPAGEGLLRLSLPEGSLQSAGLVLGALWLVLAACLAAWPARAPAGPQLAARA